MDEWSPSYLQERGIFCNCIAGEQDQLQLDILIFIESIDSERLVLNAFISKGLLLVI